MTRSTTWPEAVWGSPVLRDLDGRARAEIEAAGALLDLEEGARVYAAGEPADEFFVVLEGTVALRARARDEADARLLREVGRGEVFGEDATLRAGASRQAEARCTRATRIARVPAGVFSRAVERGGGGEVARERRRTLARAATLDLLRTMAFARTLGAKELEILLDAGERVTLSRGETLYRQGDPSDHVYFLADGMVQIRTEDDEKLHVRAYLTRGDLVGDAELESGGPRATSAVAMGATLVISVPRRVFFDLVGRDDELLRAARRVAVAQVDAQRAVAAAAKGAHTTQHVFKDLYRLDVARSLLVIDQDACVRCGHCAASCADAHGDGVSRLVRRGDRVVTSIDGDPAPLLLPSSCQHCKNPACMPDCPTGAIGRDARGEVFIREELCTGCGACARACPWDNIQMAARVASPGVVARRAAAAKHDDALPVGTSAEVAVKCDLCSAREEGPACVASCPTSAIVRIEPSAVLDDVRGALGRGPATRVVTRAASPWPWTMGAALCSAGLAASAWVSGASFLGRAGSGAMCGATLLALVGYSVFKRTRTRFELRTKIRPQYQVHLVLGVLLAGLVAVHVGSHVHANLAGALTLAVLGALLTGVLGGLAYFVVPRALSRIERSGLLPEDLPAREKELEARLFRELSGRSDVVKALFKRLLVPYVRSPWTAPALLLSRRSLRDEQQRLRDEAARVLDGRGEGKLAGLDDLLRAAVERKAIPAQRLLLAALRGWLVPHVVLSLVAVVLAVLHAAWAFR